MSKSLEKNKIVKSLLKLKNRKELDLIKPFKQPKELDLLINPFKQPTRIQNVMDEFSRRAKQKGNKINSSTGEVINPSTRIIIDFNKKFKTIKK
jgi:hypothetical protein